MEGRRKCVLSRRRKRNTRFIALSYGLCYSLTLQSGSEEFMWMWRWAALKGVTKEMAQGRWERTREGGRGGEEGESPGTREEGKSICFSEETQTCKELQQLCSHRSNQSIYPLCPPITNQFSLSVSPQEIYFSLHRIRFSLFTTVMCTFHVSTISTWL